MGKGENIIGNERGMDNEQARYRLSGAPLPSSDRHLLVVRGFTDSGDVIVNDPSGSDGAHVPRVYERDELSRAWLHNPGSSGGGTYLMWPANARDL